MKQKLQCPDTVTAVSLLYRLRTRAPSVIVPNIYVLFVGQKKFYTAHSSSTRDYHANRQMRIKHYADPTRCENRTYVKHFAGTWLRHRPCMHAAARLYSPALSMSWSMRSLWSSDKPRVRKSGGWPICSIIENTFLSPCFPFFQTFPCYRYDSYGNYRKFRYNIDINFTTIGEAYGKYIKLLEWRMERFSKVI